MTVEIRIALLDTDEELELTNLFSLSVEGDDNTIAEPQIDYVISNDRGESTRMRNTYNFSANLLKYIKIKANTPTKVVYVEGRYNI